MDESRRFRVVETLVYFVDAKDSDAAGARVYCRPPKRSEYYLHVFAHDWEDV